LQRELIDLMRGEPAFLRLLHETEDIHHPADGAKRHRSPSQDRGSQPQSRPPVAAKPEMLAAVRSSEFRLMKPGLLERQNVVLTPHVGSAIVELREAMANVVVNNIAAIPEGGNPPDCCNPEVYETQI
jgi:hypothetical protein